MALILLFVVGVVAFTEFLQLPVTELPPLEAPELEDEERRPGSVACPTGEEISERGIPIPVTSFELIECPELFDGEQVHYEGEAVGVVLLRADHAWVHLNDDPYGLRIGPLSDHRTAVGGNSGMAVTVPREVAAEVTVGGYRRHGTGVAVTGTYRLTSPLDGGAPAIHADRARITREANTFPEQLSFRRLIAAVSAAAIALVLAVANIVSRRRAHSV